VHRAPERTPIDLVELQFEDGSLDIVGDAVVWSPDEPVDAVLVKLATGLRNAGNWQGDKAFDANAILVTIAEALGQIIDIRTGPRGDPQVRQIVSLVNRGWAVTREGLDSLLSSAAWAEADGLLSDMSYLTFQRLEQQVKTFGWDNHEFREALTRLSEYTQPSPDVRLGTTPSPPRSGGTAPSTDLRTTPTVSPSFSRAATRIAPSFGGFAPNLTATHPQRSHARTSN
jgi:hypothetical protein